MIVRECSYCKKKIEGYTLKQTDYMMQQHILAKHQDKIIFPSLGKMTDGKIKLNKKREDKKK